MGIYGTTVGAHRLWSHRSFKANSFLRFWLMISQTMAGQVRRKTPLSCEQKETFELELWRRELIREEFEYSLPLSNYENSLFLHRVRFMIGFASIDSIIKHSKRPMIRSTAIKISFTLKFSRTSGSWVQTKRNFWIKSTWKTLKKTESWCSRRSQIDLNFSLWTLINFLLQILLGSLSRAVCSSANQCTFGILGWLCPSCNLCRFLFTLHYCH